MNTDALTAPASGFLERWFKLTEHGTNVRTEMVAGLTTFLTMAYIIFVNPSILGDAGMPKGAVFVATCLIAALGTTIMGLYANYPIALAPGMGLNAYLSTGGDAFYFPKQKDAEKEAAQKRLAKLLVDPATQVAFNLKKGSLPIRGDIDLAAANDCMKKGLEILKGGNLVPSGDQAWNPDVQKQNEDLMVEFWSSEMTAADAQAKWVENLKTGL